MSPFPTLFVALLNEMFAEVNITAARPAGLRNKTPERTRSRSVGDERGGKEQGRKEEPFGGKVEG